MKVEIISIARAQREKESSYLEFTARGQFAGISVELTITDFSSDPTDLKFGDVLEVSLTKNRVAVNPATQTVTVVPDELL